MTKGIVMRELAGITAENAGTYGERFIGQYGVTGARGQAEAGFPAVLKTGLPVLREGLRKGLSFNDAGCAALLHLIAVQDDTNLIRRGGREMQLEVKRTLASLLEKDPYPAIETIDQLDADFIRKDLSPGGSADLLAICYFLQFLCGENEV